MLPNRTLSAPESPEQVATRGYKSALRNDVRKAVRYSLEIDVLYTWIERGVERNSRGRTRDMSPTGAFVVGPVCPPPGATLTMSFLMPAVREDSQALRVQADSRVLRVDSQRTGQAQGFSVTHTRTILCKK